MWVSRDMWEGVLRRLDRLESGTCIDTTDGDNAVFYVSKFGEFPINKLVVRLANKAGLRLKRCHERLEFEE